MTQLLKGDMDASNDKLYNRFITICDAQLIVDALMEELLYEDCVIRVEFGRDTTRRYGHCKNTGRRVVRMSPDVDEKREGTLFLIRLNSIGMNVGTLLHEMAHISPDGESIHGHPDEFRDNLRMITLCYERMTE
jgi:hypothetical protein